MSVNAEVSGARTVTSRADQLHDRWETRDNGCAVESHPRPKTGERRRPGGAQRGHMSAATRPVHFGRTLVHTVVTSGHFRLTLAVVGGRHSPCLQRPAADHVRHDRRFEWKRRNGLL